MSLIPCCCCVPDYTAGWETGSEASSIARLHSLSFADGLFAAATAANATDKAGAATALHGNARGAAVGASSQVVRGSSGAAPGAVGSPFASVAALAWNANGHLLAVAYGRPDHTAFCDHRSAVCVWNLVRRRFDASSPDLVIETEVRRSCGRVGTACLVTLC